MNLEKLRRIKILRDSLNGHHQVNALRDLDFVLELELADYIREHVGVEVTVTINRKEKDYASNKIQW